MGGLHCPLPSPIRPSRATPGGVPRVAGSLAVTRAIGDGYLKRAALSVPPYTAHLPYITAEPEPGHNRLVSGGLCRQLHTHRIRAEHDQFVLLLSDGLKGLPTRVPRSLAPVHDLVHMEELVQWAYGYILSADDEQHVAQRLIDRIIRERVCVCQTHRAASSPVPSHHSWSVVPRCSSVCGHRRGGASTTT